MGFDFGSLGGLIGEISEIGAIGATGYNKVKDAMKGVDKETNAAMVKVEPNYSPNITPSDVFAMPNKYLFGFGAVLLVIVFILRRR